MEDFVTFEIAKKLKEKEYPQHIVEDAYIVDNYGEDEYNIGDKLPIHIIPDYMDDVAAPTIYQVLKWLREEKELHIEIYMHHNCYLWEIYNTKIYDADLSQKREKYSEIEYETYEQAALAGIEYSLDNLV